MNKLSFPQKSSLIQACRLLQAKFNKSFKQIRNQKRYEFGTMHVKVIEKQRSGTGAIKTVDGVCQIFKIYKIKTQKHTVTLYNFFYSPVVRMSNSVIQDNHFVNLLWMKITENVANTNCFTR